MTRPPRSVLPSTPTVHECVSSYFDLQAIPTRFAKKGKAQFVCHSIFLIVIASGTFSSCFPTSPTMRLRGRSSSNSPRRRCGILFSLFSDPFYTGLYFFLQGQEDRFDYCNRPRRNCLEVLYDFPHLRVPFDFLFDLFPPIKPRSFSIASSAAALPGKIQLLVAVVRYRSKLAAPRLGLCSNFLARISIGSGAAKVPIWVRPGAFAFPSSSVGGANEESPPMIMVGPGTGVAPFRSYLTEQLLQQQQRRRFVLFFGCRGQEKDYYFRSEWENLIRTHGHDRFRIVCAFSRDQVSSRG